MAVNVLSVCMCVFPCSVPHVLPNFNSPCLIHCPSVLLVNFSESSSYGCDAGFVFFSVITRRINLRWFESVERDLKNMENWRRKPQD